MNSSTNAGASATTTPSADTSAAQAQSQREALLESQRQANKDQPRNFKEDALDDKMVSVEPDGTGPTPTGTFDTEEDQRAGSGKKDQVK